MVVSAIEKQKESKQQVRGGTGAVIFEAFTKDFPAHYKMFSEVTLEKGCSIGEHTHHGESEIYYILDGEATLYDEKVPCKMKKGDFSVCYDGGTHGIENAGDAPLRFLAIIVTE